jgi:hypothetical protein
MGQSGTCFGRAVFDAFSGCCSCKKGATLLWLLGGAKGAANNRQSRYQTGRVDAPPVRFEGCNCLVKFGQNPRMRKSRGVTTLPLVRGCGILQQRHEVVTGRLFGNRPRGGPRHPHDTTNRGAHPCRLDTTAGEAPHGVRNRKRRESTTHYPAVSDLKRTEIN